MRLARLKNDFIATVTHELKTPLASMRVLVDTLLEEKLPDRRQEREYLELVARENERLSRLIDNFLTFSRMERNKQAFEMAPVDAGEIAQAAADAVRERFAAADVGFSLDIPDQMPQIDADRDAIITVLLNLLDNAFKYGGSDKSIKLRAAGGDDEVVFEVEDNGPGIPRRAQKKIFDRFYQVDSSLAREVGGAGLGLAIVKYIVDAHGGAIAVQSAPGRGSRFTVRLPIAQK
jgi:signal transduction histidine kinase